MIFNYLPDNHILITYGSIKALLALIFGFSVGTALKVLEKKAIWPKPMKTSQATLKLAGPDINLTAGQEALGKRAKNL